MSYINNNFLKEENKIIESFDETEAEKYAYCRCMFENAEGICSYRGWGVRIAQCIADGLNCLGEAMGDRDAALNKFIEVYNYEFETNLKVSDVTDA